MITCLKKCMLFCVLIHFSLPINAFESLSLKSLMMSLNPESSEGYVSGDGLLFQSGALKVSSENPDIAFSFQEGGFQANLDGLDLSYDFGPDSFLGGISLVETENLNVDYIQDSRLRVENQSLIIGHSGGRQYIPSLSLTCAANPQKSLIEDLSNQCLYLGRLQIPLLNFDQLSGKAVAKSLGTFNKSLDELEEVDLMIMNKTFNLSFKAKFLFRWKIKASGSIQFDKDNGIIDIHLAKAKVGILSLKKRLLKEIAEGDFESISINGDHILINI